MLGKLDRYMQKNETGSPIYTIQKKINSRWIKDLNVSCETIKILEENIGSKSSDIQQENMFAGTSLRALETKEKINNWDYIKLKSFCPA